MGLPAARTPGVTGLTISASRRADPGLLNDPQQVGEPDPTILLAAEAPAEEAVRRWPRPVEWWK